MCDVYFMIPDVTTAPHSTKCGDLVTQDIVVNKDSLLEQFCYL